MSQKNVMKFEKTLIISIISKNNLIVNLYTMKDIQEQKKISYKEKVNKNFHNDEIPEESSQCICLLVLFIDSAYRKDNNYYLKVFLEECKYVVREKKRCLSL